MAYCHGCGAVNADDAVTCVACDRVLTVICPQCSTRNAPAATFCSSCGRALSQSPAAGEIAPEAGIPADPAAPMTVPLASPAAASRTPDLPPRAPFMKVVLGGFAFAFLYLSQALSGYPLAGILAGLASGLITLWGAVELSLWALERHDPRQAAQLIAESQELAEELPAPLAPDTEPIGGSFEEVDKEARLVKPEGMVSSMVASMPDLETEPSSRPRPQPAPSAPDALADVVPQSMPADEPILGAEEAELTRREKASQTLAEFLDDGIAQEITLVRKKLAKNPGSYPLMLRLAQLQEERGEVSNALDTMDGCLKSGPQAPEVHLYHGSLLRRAGEPDKAREAFQKALALNKYLAKAHYQLGSLERAAKRIPEARDALQKCIQLTPDDPYAHYQLGMVYRELGEMQLAQLELKRACMLHPTDSYGHSQLGQTYQTAHQWDQAILEYSQALSFKPNDPYVLEKLGEVMIEKGEHARAAELLQEALSHQFHPEPRTMITLGRVLRSLGRMRDLSGQMLEVLRLSPGNPDAMFLLAQAYIADQDHAKAIATLLELLEAVPDRAEAWLELGKLYQAQGKEEEAIAAFTKASPNAADQAGVWNTIGVLLTNRRDYAEALKAFRKALSFDYSDTQIQNNLKAVQKKIESNCRRTIETSEEALALDSSDLGAYLKMGMAYEMIDRPDEAMMAYQRMLSIKPDSVEGLTAYADLLKRRGKLKMSMRCYREILKIRPDHADARLHLIRGHLALGFVNEALRHAVVAQKLLPEDPRIHFLLGKIYFAKGLAPRALREFTLVANSTQADPEMVSWAELMRRRLQKKS
ncbi:MAG TPA: tetratricopeptide repeat protein [Candidatus Ozemobacteraceae bacterium]|nr:tetratricopeptide repeat protein [Candidatus Ozemobacteraceae bacterium]